jgi:hypothetical protein
MFSSMYYNMQDLWSRRQCPRPSVSPPAVTGLAPCARRQLDGNAGKMRW